MTEVTGQPTPPYPLEEPPCPTYQPPGVVPQEQPPPYMPVAYPVGPAPYAGSPAPQPGFVTGPQEVAASYKVEEVPPAVIPIADTVISEFEDKTVRRAFIRKVFSVVTLQLLVTFTVVCVFTFSGTVRAAVQGNIWIYLSSYITFVVVAVSLTLCSTFSRSHPWNMIGLGIVTLSMSYMVGTVASYHDTTAVVIAMGATLAVSFTIILFSAQTRVDFTLCNGILLVLAVDLLMFGFFSCFFYSRVLQIVYGCLGALLYSLFLAVDCQLVMGREKYALSPEEYVFAALIIYLDIITIFLYLLMLLGGNSSN